LRAEDLDATGRCLLFLRRQDREDRDAVDLDLGLDPDDVADLGALRQQRRRHRPLRLPGAGGAPCEGVVVPSARKLYVHPVRHDRPKLQLPRHEVVMSGSMRISHPMDGRATNDT